MKVKFDEGPDAVEIDELRLRVERGEVADVPPEVGERLLEQGWSEVKEPKRGQKAATKED